MSILIKGMDMPREGASLFIEVNSIGHIICQYSDDIVHYGYKNRAVPVPTPHGRLGDLDKLLQEAKDLSGPMTGDGWDNYGVYALIERQPTAIEAEAD